MFRGYLIVALLTIAYSPPTTMQAESTRSTVDIFQTPASSESGEDALYDVYTPGDGRYYSPHIGYVPYWEGGEWVFTKKKYSTGDARDMCGFKCNRVYKSYGNVCGRNIAGDLKNFTNFCHLKSYDCSGKLGWRIAYRGNCRDRIIPDQPRHVWEYTKRALSIVSAFYLFNVTLDNLDSWSSRGKRNVTKKL